MEYLLMAAPFIVIVLYVLIAAFLERHDSKSHSKTTKDYTKADLEQDARRDWDEQVKALGGSDPELYFSKPCLSGERTIFDVGGLTFKEYHAAALERFYAFSEGGFIDPSPPTTNELNS